VAQEETIRFIDKKASNYGGYLGQRRFI
jgi:hypothetical protein